MRSLWAVPIDGIVRLSYHFFSKLLFTVVEMYEFKPFP
jgi:hypothetical protein